MRLNFLIVTFDTLVTDEVTIKTIAHRLKKERYFSTEEALLKKICREYEKVTGATTLPESLIVSIKPLDHFLGDLNIFIERDPPENAFEPGTDYAVAVIIEHPKPQRKTLDTAG